MIEGHFLLPKTYMLKYVEKETGKEVPPIIHMKGVPMIDQTEENFNKLKNELNFNLTKNRISKQGTLL